MLLRCSRTARYCATCELRACARGPSCAFVQQLRAYSRLNELVDRLGGPHGDGPSENTAALLLPARARGIRRVAALAREMPTGVMQARAPHAHGLLRVERGLETWGARERTQATMRRSCGRGATGEDAAEAALKSVGGEEEQLSALLARIARLAVDRAIECELLLSLSYSYELLFLNSLHCFPERWRCTCR